MNKKLLFAMIAGSALALGFLSYFIKRKEHNNFPNSQPSSFNVANALNKKELIDVLIIGSGPAGLPAAVYASRLGRKALVLNGNQKWGQLMKTSYIENWPGNKKILGKDLMRDLADQAQHFGAQFWDDAAEKIDTSIYPYEVTTENGKKIHALSIIVATGSSPLKLNIPGEEEYESKGVTSCAICDAPFYKNLDVVVIGGGDSAVEEAIQLTPYAKTITMLVRKDRMRASAIMQDRLKGYKNISVKYNVEPKAIVGDGNQVTGIELYNNQTKETAVFPTNGVFLAIGHKPNSDLVKNIVALDEQGYILVKDRSQETSVPGIFAAGDIEDHDYRQAGVAAGSGIKAAIDADRFLAAAGLDEIMKNKLAPNYITVQKEKANELSTIETAEQLEEISQQKLPIVLDFYTDSCPSCLQMMPIFAGLKEHFVGKALLFKVNAEIATTLVERFYVLSVPCFVVVKDGALVGRYSEVMNRQELIEFIEQFVE